MKPNRPFGCDSLPEDSCKLAPVQLSLHPAARTNQVLGAWSLLELLRLPQREAPPVELVWRVVLLFRNSPWDYSMND